MAGAFGGRTRKRKVSINITSLIDVMFLLLIFFMVSSTFREQLGIDVALPEAHTASETETDSHEITVNAEGEFYFGQQRVDESGLRDSITGVLAQDPGATLVLRLDKGAQADRFVRAMDIARDAGGVNLVIPTRFMPESKSSG